MRICPYSMATEPAECYQEDCMAWNDGECFVFFSEPLSQFFTAKNTRAIASEIQKTRKEDDRTY